MPGIVESTFVEKDFYLDPPAKGSSEAEWNTWMLKDGRKRSAAKAVHTKSLEHAEVPDEYQSCAMLMTGGDGVHRQSTGIGFSGDFENGQGTLERPVEAKQEHHIALVNMEGARNKRGGSRKGKSARRRANRKRRNK